MTTIKQLSSQCLAGDYSQFFSFQVTVEDAWVNGRLYSKYSVHLPDEGGFSIIYQLLPPELKEKFKEQKDRALDSFLEKEKKTLERRKENCQKDLEKFRESLKISEQQRAELMAKILPKPKNPLPLTFFEKVRKFATNIKSYF